MKKYTGVLAIALGMLMGFSSEVLASRWILMIRTFDDSGNALRRIPGAYVIQDVGGIEEVSGEFNSGPLGFASIPFDMNATADHVYVSVSATDGRSCYGEMSELKPFIRQRVFADLTLTCNPKPVGSSPVRPSRP